NVASYDGAIRSKACEAAAICAATFVARTGAACVMPRPPRPMNTSLHAPAESVQAIHLLEGPAMRRGVLAPIALHREASDLQIRKIDPAGGRPMSARDPMCPPRALAAPANFPRACSTASP